LISSSSSKELTSSQVFAALVHAPAAAPHRSDAMHVRQLADSVCTQHFKCTTRMFVALHASRYQLHVARMHCCGALLAWSAPC
jgi:hypothetical protein